MKRVEQLIDMARKLSGNTSYDENSGVPQSVFVQYLNNAQDSLTKEVVNLKTKYLLKQKEVPVVSGQEKYDYPDDIYMQHIDTIQWLDKAQGTYFQNLYKSYTKEKVTTTASYPFGYIPQNDGIHLNPPITSGTLMVSYIKRFPKLQKKSGLVMARTLNNSNQITAIVLDVSDATYDENEINDDYFLCVVDKYGKQKAVNVEYESVSNGVFTMSAHSLSTGESISVGDYICVGKNTVNIPLWDDVCESYLLKHMVYDAKYSDSSQWSQEAKDDMRASFAQLAGSFASLSDDVSDIPLTDLSYIGY